MGDLSDRASSSAKVANDRLDSWKEIAAYLNRDVTTVQRWEKREGMPVHRHQHDRIGSVYASRSELDSWSRSRNLTLPNETPEGAASVAGAIATEPQTLQTWRKLALPFLLIAGGLLVLAGVAWWQSSRQDWRNPIADSRFQPLTDFDGVAQAATISRDGQFVAFLSDRDGHMDVWVTQPGSGQFHNLTQGSVPNLGNAEVRNLEFSPDGSLVAFWTRQGEGPSGIGIWAVPTLGGVPKSYLDGVAEFDWSRDGTQLAYHTPGPGDPLFVSDGRRREGEKPIFTAASGLHSHFPTWSPDSKFIYFVQGELPGKLDLWRIRPIGGEPERITSQTTRMSHPVWLNSRTLLYLASDPDGSGPWLYGMDTRRRVAQRLSAGLDRYTSLAASADGRKLVASLAHFNRTLWRMPFPLEAHPSEPERIRLTTPSGFAARYGQGYLLYVSSSTTGDSLWRQVDGPPVEVWSEPDAKILGAPAIARDGKSVAFVVEARGKSSLYAMQANGTNLHLVTEALDFKGSPTWTPDGDAILIAANEGGRPHLYRVPANGSAPPAVFVAEDSLDPTWSPNGEFVLYSGADIGTTFSLKARTSAGAERSLAALNLTRGARHLVFGPGGRGLLVLRGDLQHKDLWLVDLDSGSEQQLTHFPADFRVRDFDLSPDGREIVLEREQERSEVMLMELAQR